uniref:SH3 domain-containing kinase-binding protein 1 n=1 Tax=Panagrellus redivivus TaxID=6233 RepID=A0A7E4ZW20_PANRE
MSTVSTEGAKPGNVAQLINRMSQHQHQILGTGRPEVSIRKDKNAPSSARAKFYQARYSYKAVEDDELTFGEGAYIEHVEDIEDGWKRGRLLETGKIGAFPENFVTKCDPPPSHATSASVSTGITEPLRVATSFDSKPLPTSGNGTSGNGSKAHALASKAVRTSLVDPLQASGSDAAVATNAVPGKLIKERALVKYSYSSSRDDELDLFEGTYITIVNKHTSDEDWFEGEYNGRRGLFPSNHVQIVASDKTVLPPVPSASSGGAGASGPPTPPPIKPKPAGSAPLGLIGTTPPPATSTTTTPPSGGSNVKLLRQQVFGNMPPPKPGDKPNFGRPKTTVFENINFGPSDGDDSSSVSATVASGGGGDAEPLRHLNRERPKQAKRPPSMKPVSSTEIEPPTSISAAPTTSFPAKEPLPVTAAASAIATAAASRQSVLIPKKDSPEVLPKVPSGSDKPFRYHTTHTETVLSPTKSKPATPISASAHHHDTSSDHETPVSRAEFNELKLIVERLTREIRELRENRA